jgi:hypothetical protein
LDPEVLSEAVGDACPFCGSLLGALAGLTRVPVFDTLELSRSKADTRELVQVMRTLAHRECFLSWEFSNVAIQGALDCYDREFGLDSRLFRSPNLGAWAASKETASASPGALVMPRSSMILEQEWGTSANFFELRARAGQIATLLNAIRSGALWKSSSDLHSFHGSSLRLKVIHENSSGHQIHIQGRYGVDTIAYVGRLDVSEVRDSISLRNDLPGQTRHTRDPLAT